MYKKLVSFLLILVLTLGSVSSFAATKPKAQTFKSVAEAYGTYFQMSSDFNSGYQFTKKSFNFLGREHTTKVVKTAIEGTVLSAKLSKDKTKITVTTDTFEGTVTYELVKVSTSSIKIRIYVADEDTRFDTFTKYKDLKSIEVALGKDKKALERIKIEVAEVAAAKKAEELEIQRALEERKAKLTEFGKTMWSEDNPISGSYGQSLTEYLGFNIYGNVIGIDWFEMSFDKVRYEPGKVIFSGNASVIMHDNPAKLYENVEVVINYTTRDKIDSITCTKTLPEDILKYLTGKTFVYNLYE